MADLIDIEECLSITGETRDYFLTLVEQEHYPRPQPVYDGLDARGRKKWKWLWRRIAIEEGLIRYRLRLADIHKA